MNYIVCTSLEAKDLMDQLYPRRGIGLLEINSVKVDPLGIQLKQLVSQSFQDNELNMLDYVKELIELDVIIFAFGGKLIQYTKKDLLKVLCAFDDSVWVNSEADRLELIRFLNLKIDSELPA